MAALTKIRTQYFHADEQHPQHLSVDGRWLAAPGVASTNTIDIHAAWLTHSAAIRGCSTGSNRAQVQEAWLSGGGSPGHWKNTLSRTIYAANTRLEMALSGTAGQR
jgi:hypothetical protein